MLLRLQSNPILSIFSILSCNPKEHKEHLILPCYTLQHEYSSSSIQILVWVECQFLEPNCAHFLWDFCSYFSESSVLSLVVLFDLCISFIYNWVNFLTGYWTLMFIHIWSLNFHLFIFSHRTLMFIHIWSL
jgi:hypothetical protein